MRILLVEDDAKMRALVSRGLSEEGHTVDVADDGRPALDLAEANRYDVMVLDVMLPGLSGIDVVRSLRGEDDQTPALLLTARDAASDIVAGLDAGADDYLTKPFAFKVLLARLRALTRRSTTGPDAVLQAADLRLDRSTHSVTRSGAAVSLTPTEFTLLDYLMATAGRVVTRERLMERLWGADREVGGNTLDAFVKSLRQKLDARGRHRVIHTIRGIGYCLREEPES